MRKSKTPLYDQFNIYLSKVLNQSGHTMWNDIFPETFEKFVNELIKKSKNEKK